MATLTFLQMQSRVKTVIRDASNVFVLATEIKEWLNEAQTDLAGRLRVTQKELLQSDAGAAQFTGGALVLPTDFMEIQGLRLGTVSAHGTDDVSFTDPDTWWHYSDNGLDVPNDGFIGRIWAGKIEVYPAPVANAFYKLRYVYQPIDLVADGDVSALPDEWHIRMVQYGRAHAKYKEGEDGQGDRYLTLYETGLPSLRSPRSQLRPGPITLTNEWNAFDSDTESIHL